MCFLLDLAHKSSQELRLLEGIAFVFVFLLGDGFCCFNPEMFAVTKICWLCLLFLLQSL